MNKINYILRLLTLAVYFLPFSFLYVSCNGHVYSKVEIEKIRDDSIKQADSIKQITYAKEVSNSSLIENNSATTMNDTFKRTLADTLFVSAVKFLVGGFKVLDTVVDAIYNNNTITIPDKKSVSGISITQTFLNTFGKSCIWASIILSILSFLAEWFFRKKSAVIKGLLFINLLSVIAFIINAYTIKVDLRYGVWCLFAILILQIYLEIRRTITRTDT